MLNSTANRLPRFFFNRLIFIYFFEYKTIETHARAFLPLNISSVGSVYPANVPAADEKSVAAENDFRSRFAKVTELKRSSGGHS